jgi:hypothetical protein
MKKLLILCAVFALMSQTESWVGAAVVETKLIVPKGGLKGVFQTDISTNQSFTGEDLLVDPVNNHLVLDVFFDDTTKFDTITWSLLEVDANGDLFDRDGITGGIQSEIMNSDGSNSGGPVFIKGGKTAKGVTPIAEGDASRVGPIPLGDHNGVLDLTAKIGTGVVALKGKALGQADVLPDDSEQLIFRFTIKAAQ